MINFLPASPILDVIANAAAASTRGEIDASRAGLAGAQRGSAPKTNAVLDAQAQSAAAAAQAVQVRAENAQGFDSLAKKGLTVTAGSFAGIYKNQLLQVVDPSGSGTVDRSNLERQVTKGGGSAAQADSLFKAMDENGDGTVSDQEFEDSIPDPFAADGDFAQKFISQLKEQQQMGGSLPTQALDASLILGNLATQQSASVG